MCPFYCAVCTIKGMSLTLLYFIAGYKQIIIVYGIYKTTKNIQVAAEGTF